MNVWSRFALAVALLTAISSTASAALTITSADISGGHYVYDLDFNKTADSTMINNDALGLCHLSDALSVSNLMCHLDLWAPPHVIHEVMPYYTRQPSAGLIYKFDFSDTNFRPTALGLRENFVLFTNIHGHDLTHALSEWSSDMSTWHTITDFTTPQQFPGGGVLVDFSTPISGMPDVIYYRMTMTTLPGDGDGVLTADQNQWNRIESDNNHNFHVDFTMQELPVAEPAALGLLGIGLMAMRRRRP